MQSDSGAILDQSTAVKEMHAIVEKTQQRMKETEQAREREQQETIRQLEQLRQDWSREKRDVAEKNAKVGFC